MLFIYFCAIVSEKCVGKYSHDVLVHVFFVSLFHSLLSIFNLVLLQCGHMGF
jgi:hypothetical protein